MYTCQVMTRAALVLSRSAKCSLAARGWQRHRSVLQTLWIVRRWLGVDRVFLTDNNGVMEALQNRAALADFVRGGFLTLDHEARPAAQEQVNRRCLEQHRAEVNWLTFFDIDEFLVLRDPCALLCSCCAPCRVLWRLAPARMLPIRWLAQPFPKSLILRGSPSAAAYARLDSFLALSSPTLPRSSRSLPQPGKNKPFRSEATNVRSNSSLKGLLDRFKFFPGLSVSWVYFGPNGREERPAGGGVLRHYTRCEGGPDSKVGTLKTIGNTFFIAGLPLHNPHNMFFRCGCGTDGGSWCGHGGHIPLGR